MSASSVSQPHVRPAQPQDRAALFEICLKTADGGVDATPFYSDPDYPGLVWAVPYLDFAPAHCFVVDVGGRAGGYIVGTADTAAFERRLAESWWPMLRTRYAGRAAEAPFDDKVLRHFDAPLPPSPTYLSAYPAHLHINLLPALQSGGWGRRLMEAELDSLRRAGAPGVHLGVARANHRAIGFYRHMGFAEIGDDDDDAGDGLLLGRAL